MRMLARALALLAALALGSCGGDSGMVAGVGSGGSGAPLAVSVGAVTGFGSIIVNGQRYDESRAEVFVDERPDRATPATVDAVRLGMHVELKHRDFVIDTITASSELVGPVASVGAASFVALGQTVRVNADPAHPTAYEGLEALVDLAPGTVVEVHGDRGASGEILATRIALRPASLGYVRVAGTASTVNGRNFAIAALPVDASTASLLPAGVALANGQRVVVWSDAPIAGTTLAARIVRIDTPTIVDNTPVTVAGVVTEFRAASSFRVGSVHVNAGGASFSGGSATDLANGVSVRVRGPYVNGVLDATNVDVLQAAVVVQLAGAITDFVDPQSAFRIRGSLVRVTSQTTYTGGSEGNLGTGVLVKVEGPLVDGIVQATTLEFQPVPAPQPPPTTPPATPPTTPPPATPPADTQRVVVGQVIAPVTPLPDGGRSFRLDAPAIEVKTAAATAFRNGTSADIVPGRRVRVAGRVQAEQFVADEVQFLDNPSAPTTVQVDGTAASVQPTSFVVNGNPIALTSGTRYTVDGAPGTSASLQNGVQVQVVATREGDNLTAVSVDVRPPAVEASTVRGIVSGRTPPGALVFLVGSQRVSVVDNPQIVPGNRTLADVVNGADVEVEGRIADGVLVATRIKFR